MRRTLRTPAECHAPPVIAEGPAIEHGRRCPKVAERLSDHALVLFGIPVQIILVHKNLTQARSISLTKRHVVIAAISLGLSTLVLSAVLAWFGIKIAVLSGLFPFQSWFATSADSVGASDERYVKENLEVLASKLGEVQAKLVKLDAIGERVATLTGIKAPDSVLEAGKVEALAAPGRQDARDPGPVTQPSSPPAASPKPLPGSGGASPSREWTDASALTTSLSLPQLANALEQIQKAVDAREDALALLETELMEKLAKAKLFPSNTPVNAGFAGSGFGMRLDPFSRRRSMHEGVDFAAAVGTPILAAAGGIVVKVERHPEYGNMVDIDHGKGLMTRYAHASRIAVQEGQIVRAGQHVADVGSTGRSTGPHLHFEVHLDGVPQNPMQFLLASGGGRTAQSAASPIARGR